MYIIERQLHGKFQSLPSPFGKAALPAASDGAPAVQRLFSPRWRWPATLSTPPPVLGAAPQCHPLDLLGVFDPPPSAASIHCALPDAVLVATEHGSQAFGAPPFALLLAILGVYERCLAPSSNEPPILVGLFGPGAAAARRAAMAIHPEAARHMIDLYAVRGAPDDPSDDPLLRGVWPVLCPAYLPAMCSPARSPTALAHSPHEPERRAFASERATCNQREVLMSICADDAEASHLPPDVRLRVTALPNLMDRLFTALTTLAAPDGTIERLEPLLGAHLVDEMAESAFELVMIAHAHLIAFYARVRPARTGSVHRAAAAMLRHHPLFISPTTLTSGISGQVLRTLEAAGWLEARDEETLHGLAHRFTPSDALLRLDKPELPKKRASRPHPVNVLCDEML